jgi:hypothetical protein
MRPRTIDLVLWIAFGIVAAVAGLVGVVMLVAPGDTEDYFAWGLGPEPLAALVGGFYVASTVVFALAIRRPWREVRGLVAAVLGLTIPTLTATLVHSEVFDFSRPVAVIWLLLFIGSPLTYGTILVLRRSEDAGGPRVEPTVLGALFAALAAALAGFAFLCWFARVSASDLVPFALSPMGGAFLGAWALFLAVLAAWAWRGRPDEGRIPLIGLVAYPAGALVAAVRTWGDLEGAREAWVLVLFAIAVLAFVALSRSRAGARMPIQ